MCFIYTDCITEINDTQVDDAQKVYVVMLMYNLIEYSGAYSKTLGSLWQHYRNEPALDNNGEITDFPVDNSNSKSLKVKQPITAETENDSTKDVEIMVSSKYLSNFWRTLEMSLINCAISLQLKW